MRDLTLEEIKKILKSYPEASRRGVNGFLMSLGANETENAAVINLNYDRVLYSWNAQTVKAILKGIELGKTERN